MRKSKMKVVNTFLTHDHTFAKVAESNKFVGRLEAIDLWNVGSRAPVLVEVLEDKLFKREPVIRELLYWDSKWFETKLVGERLALNQYPIDSKEVAILNEIFLEYRLNAIDLLTDE